jgi:hypothetical protein
MQMIIFLTVCFFINLGQQLSHIVAANKLHSFNGPSTFAVELAHEGERGMEDLDDDFNHVNDGADESDEIASVVMNSDSESSSDEEDEEISTMQVELNEGEESDRVPVAMKGKATTDGGQSSSSKSSLKGKATTDGGQSSSFKPSLKGKATTDGGQSSSSKPSLKGKATTDGGQSSSSKGKVPVAAGKSSREIQDVYRPAVRHH